MKQIIWNIIAALLVIIAVIGDINTANSTKHRIIPETNTVQNIINTDY